MPQNRACGTTVGKGQLRKKQGRELAGAQDSPTTRGRVVGPATAKDERSVALGIRVQADQKSEGIIDRDGEFVNRPRKTPSTTRTDQEPQSLKREAVNAGLDDERSTHVVYPCRLAPCVFAIAWESQALPRYYSAASVPIGSAVGVRAITRPARLAVACNIMKIPEIESQKPLLTSLPRLLWLHTSCVSFSSPTTRRAQRVQADDFYKPRGRKNRRTPRRRVPGASSFVPGTAATLGS